MRADANTDSLNAPVLHFNPFLISGILAVLPGAYYVITTITHFDRDNLFTLLVPIFLPVVMLSPIFALLALTITVVVAIRWYRRRILSDGLALVLWSAASALLTYTAYHFTQSVGASIGG